MEQYDYIILCTPRSGSHVLATMLNSHPDIACIGESNERMPELIHSSGKIKGKIIMYMRTDYEGVFDNVKIIHLVRDTKEIARSRIINSSRKFDSHYTKQHEFSFTINPDEVNKMSKNLANDIDSFRKKIKDKPVLEIKYSELTDGGKSVETLNKKTSDKILNFLEVDKDYKLVTNLKKPIWNLVNTND